VIVPIVEGQSEERAMGVLMRRILHEGGIFEVPVGRPFRVKRQRVVRPGELEKSVIQAERSREGASVIFVVLDADDDCPAELAPELLRRVENQTQLQARVVLAKVEIEAWVLAGIESLRGIRGIRDDAEAPHNPEGIRDCKGALTSLMDGTRGYVATDDLPALVDGFDVALANSRCPSFAKFRRDLLGATQS
jgi:hypothetical protein